MFKSSVGSSERIPPDVGQTAANIFIPIILVSALTACQPGAPPAVSLEEAKKTTQNFEGQPFIPPPRSVADIEILLASQPTLDKSRIQKLKAQAQRKPREGAGDEELFAFYRARAVAAENLGKIEQQIANLRTALKYLDTANSRDRNLALRQLAVTELRVGNFAKGIEIIKQLERQVNDEGSFGGKITTYGVLVRYYAWAGRIRLADDALMAAETAYNRYAKIRSRLGQPPRNSILRNINHSRGIVLQEKGLYADAEKYFRRAVENAKAERATSSDGFNEDRLFARAENLLADNLVRQERYVEAETIVRNALKDSLQRNGRFAFRTAEHLQLLARIIWAQGRVAEAERLSRAVLEIYAQMGISETAVRVIQARNVLGATLANQEKWIEAVKAFEANETAIARQPKEYQQRTDIWPVYPIALMRTGEMKKAELVAREIVNRNTSGKGRKHYDTAEARGIMAMVLKSAGKSEKALEVFAGSIPILLQRSRRSEDERATKGERAWRRRLILESYIGLLNRRGDKVSWSESFRLADVARSQAVQRALAASAARAAAKNADLTDLVRREQDTLKQIGALYGRLVNAVSVQTAELEMTAVRVRIDKLRRARAALAEEIEQRFPDYAALMNPRPATIAEARKSLRPGEALIATYVGEKKTYVWAVPKSGRATFASVDVGRAALAGQVAGLRKALDPEASTLGAIPAFDVATSHDLFQKLLAPVSSGWKSANSLLVVAHGPLGQLPFSLFVTNPHKLAKDQAPLFSNYRAVPFLVRSHAVTVVPSVSSLVTLRGLPAASPARRAFAGFGDPYFSKSQARAAAPASHQLASVTSRGLLQVRGLPVHLRAAPALDGVASADLASLPRLEDTADEVKSMALAMNADLTRDVFTGKRASEGRVKSMKLSGYKVLAFATHGLVPGDLNGLTQPALALSSPKVTGEQNDGLLTMGEILGLKLDADWVVLSACNTASGDGAGAEAISGLGRAFFYAGTRALLVSNWPVETTSARALTTAIFARQAKDVTLSRAQALRRSMLALIDKGGRLDPAGRIVFSYAHPIFWAPFSLVGDGSGKKPAG